MYGLIKSLLFLLSPEKAHYTTMWLLKTGLQLPLIRSWLKGKPVAPEPVSLFGLDFPNKVGLAAGFDKNAAYIDILAELGFGFIEVGTVTPRPQPGNPKPRLFRLPKDKALINRMGFNNDGVDAMVEKLKTRKNTRVIIGGNIGKNKDTPNDKAFEDYLVCLEKLHDHVDYFVVNVSSPNTPGLRDLQEKEPLKKLLSGLMEANARHTIPKPILLKIAPDLTESQLDDILEIYRETGIHGLIATNTTISREKLSYPPETIESIGMGGLSGLPVREKSTEVIRYLNRNGQIPVIGAGGILTPLDAAEKMAAGASLVQVYTGFIYEGPHLIRDIAQQLNGR